LFPTVPLGMASNKQQTFGNISVNKYNGDRGCDECLRFNEDGEPVRCGNSASYAILRHKEGLTFFYCKIHAKDTWVEMANSE